MSDRAVEILAADHADEAVVLGHEDPALAVALAGDERVRDRVVRRNGARGARHDLGGGDGVTDSAR